MSEFDVPPGWPDPTAQHDDLLNDTVETTLTALSEDTERPATDRVAAYYDPNTRWAGVTFVEMQPTDPIAITAADLHALTLLNAGVGPLATRTLLEDADTQAAIATALAQIDPAADLRRADRSLFEAMDHLWWAIWDGCTDPWAKNSNPWVTVSKLCARKRPGLFPVRDSVVCEGLRLYGTTTRPRGNYKLDWQVFQNLIAHPDINTALHNLQDQVHSRHKVRCDRFNLRILDVALWTWLRRN